ncbi:MAG TPA: hypothetical protein ENJ66_06500, partial [Calditrichae bacterium]|nr:hypothetical protein [Calditrichia bacterium]
DLRPSTTAFWCENKNGKPRAFSIIASEEQAVQQMMQLLDAEGLVDGGAPDETFVSNGMISRFHYDEQGTIHQVEFLDRYGQPIEVPEYGEHYSFRRTPLHTPDQATELEHTLDELLANPAKAAEQAIQWIESGLPEWDFNTYRWVLTRLAEKSVAKFAGSSDPKGLREAVQRIFTHFVDYLRRMPTGRKAKSSLLDITRQVLYYWLDALPAHFPQEIVPVTIQHPEVPEAPAPEALLFVDATGFQPEGTDPRHTLAALLRHAYDRGWRRYVLYRVNGQRLISTAVMGTADTDDVEIDVYGTPGEYFGAFMQGGTIRCHGNAQNFCAMGMHHGNLIVYGNAGKVCGYASKGGKVVILGDIVDRAWTNSVNDPRCQELEVHILGSASKYCGESLMGGRFFFGGMYFDASGALRIQERPYRGTKLLGGASRGKMLFFDPYKRLDPHQYTHGKVEPLAPEEWPRWKEMVRTTLREAGVPIRQQNGREVFEADGKTFAIVPEHFTLIVPKGGLKGYESH